MAYDETPGQRDDAVEHDKPTAAASPGPGRPGEDSTGPSSESGAAAGTGREFDLSDPAGSDAAADGGTAQISASPEPALTPAPTDESTVQAYPPSPSPRPDAPEPSPRPEASSPLPPGDGPAPSPWAPPQTQTATPPAGQPAYPPPLPGYQPYPSPQAGYTAPTQPIPGAPGSTTPAGYQPTQQLPGGDPGSAPGASGPGAGVPGGQPVGGVPPEGASPGPVPPGAGGSNLFNEPAEPPARTGSRRKWALAGMALALVAAVVGGALGGVVGYQIASNGGRLSVLDAPLPDPDSTATPPTAVEQVAQRTLPTVVQLRVSSAQQAGAGSGMVLSPDGLILTNNHVIELAVGGAGQIVVLFQGGKTAPADIIGRDPTSDIAVVKARNVSGLSPITLGNSEAVRVGQQVVAIGSPLGLGGTVTTGIVSALNRAVSVGPDDPPSGPLANSPSEVLDAIQTDAPINPGNSGGPLVDIAGRVIGINTAIASVGGIAGEQSGSVGLGFAIPINQAKRIAEEIERNGQANMPVLKVQVQSASRPAAVSGVVGAKVIQVDPAGPGGQAGLKVNDVIVKVDERAITTGDELVAAVRSHAPGDTVALGLSDGRVVQAVLGAAPVVAGR